MKRVFLVSFIIMIHVFALAITINVPADYPTIQQAIAAAAPGDSVLAAVGIYHENINFMNKEITLCSWFAVTQDTSYISQTVIDGGGLDSVVKIESGIDSTAMLCGFTIRNGFADTGGGVYCYYSDPTLKNLIIENNHADYGGAIGCTVASQIVINEVVVRNNSAEHGGGIGIGSNCSADISNSLIAENSAHAGGGIYLYGALVSANISNIEIAENQADCGGGLYCVIDSLCISHTNIIGNHANDTGGGIYFDSDLIILHSAICNNYAGESGGGIAHLSSLIFDLNLIDVDIKGNQAGYYGGGLYCFDALVYLSQSSISHNSAATGGGITISGPSPVFDSDDRNSIYLNNCGRAVGADMDICCENLSEVALDTFTVAMPTDYHISSFSTLEYDFLHVMQEQVNANLYVSPQGDNANTGISPFSPLKTIQHACSIIISNAQLPKTIFLLPGIYALSSNGETFPVQLPAYVSLAGSSSGSVILDAEEQSSVMHISGLHNITISNITMKNGNAIRGGAINASFSDFNLINVALVNNFAEMGGAVFFNCCSDILLQNVTTANCYCRDQGGAFYLNYSQGNFFLINSIIWDCGQESCFFNEFDGDFLVLYSDLQYAQNCSSAPWNFAWMDANIDADPLFADTINNDYSLLYNSPCIDSGTHFFEYNQQVIVDISNNQYYGTAPDMGALEFYPSPAAKQELPDSSLLCHIFPNPCNPHTHININVPSAQYIQLAVYNIKGQMVNIISDKLLPAGNHSFFWDGCNNSGKCVSSGIYFIKITNRNQNFLHKIMLIK